MNKTAAIRLFAYALQRRQQAGQSVDPRLMQDYADEFIKQHKLAPVTQIGDVVDMHKELVMP